MITQCPYCKQQYDVENEALGQYVDCPECNKSFQVESLNSSSNEDDDNKNNIEKKRFVSPAFLIGVLALVILLISSSVGLWLYSKKPSKEQAIENRANFRICTIKTKYQINNKDAIKTLCKERAKLELKAAEANEIDDQYISFWCDKNIRSIIKDKNKVYTTEELVKRFQENMDVKHPEYKAILVLTDRIEDEFSPVEEIILKHGYVRSLFLVEQDKKFPKINSIEMFNDVEKRLNSIFYNLYSKDSEIEYPDELREFCSERAKEMLSIIQEDRALAIDWAKIILSDEMKKEIETGLAKNGTTVNVLYWLDSFGEKQIPPIPYKCRATYYLRDINFSYKFEKDYKNISLYGETSSN